MRAYDGIPDVLCPDSSCHPTEETHCCCLYLRLPKSGPTVYNHRWSLKDRWTGKSTSLDSMMIWHNACSTDDAAPNYPSFPSLVHKTTRYLNSFAPRFTHGCKPLQWRFRCFFFGLHLVQAHGLRPGHQKLAVGLPSYVWLQKGALVPPYQMRHSFSFVREGARSNWIWFEQVWLTVARKHI